MVEKIEKETNQVIHLGFFFRLDEERNEQVESKPEEILESEEDVSDNPDNELGAVMEFDEDELDEAQTEAEVKNITNKHHITIEELKREVLGSVRKKFFFFFIFELHLPLRFSFSTGPEYNNQNNVQEQLACKGLRSGLQAYFSVLIDLLSPPRFK